MNAPKPPDSSSISIILVSWNRRDDLAVALASIRAQDFPSIEIIVVENGSTDGTIEMLREGRFAPLTLYRAGRNLGASRARNIGLRLASAPLVAFMDSDAELIDPATLKTLAAQLQSDPNLAGIAPAIYTDRACTEPWHLGGYHLRGLYSDIGRSREEHLDPEYLTTCFSLWRRDPIEKIGGFDPELPYGFEDNDLSLRLTAAGWKIAVDPTQQIVHHLSPAARIRAESDGWSHFHYDERARCLIQLKRFGFFGFLREEAWQWSKPGRTQRYYIHLHSGLRRRQKLMLYTLIPLRALLTWPRTLLRCRNADWVASIPMNKDSVERISDAQDGRS